MAAERTAMTASAISLGGRTGVQLGWLGLAFLALLTFLPGFATLPVTDRDEARFVQASRQMVQSGDFIDIRFQDDARYKKPVGIYWLQNVPVALSGQSDAAPLWVYRLSSLAGAVLSVLLVAVVGAPLVGQGPAFLAGALFASGLVIGGEARIAKTDAALLVTILVSQAALVRLWLAKEAPRGWVYAFWLSLAAGVLIKGPVGPMVPALTILALTLWERRAAWLRPLLSPGAILLALAVALPWFIAITLRSDGTFWQASVGQDLLAKVVSGQEGKGAPPGTHLLAMFLTFWPAAALLILVVPQIWAARAEPATRFLIAWAVPVWLVFEAVPTKLVHYTLPVLPALALLAVGHLGPAQRTARPWLKGLFLLALLPGPVLAAAVIYAAVATGATDAAILLSTGLTTALAAFALAVRFLIRSETVPLILACAAAGAILHMSLFAALPRMPVLWPTEQAMAIANDIAGSQGCTRPKVTAWGYTEPSVVWTAGREARLLPADTPWTEVSRAGPCQVVIAEQGASAGAVLPGCRSAGVVDGFAIGAGRHVTLDIFDCRGLP
jgi:4-amino-4-deoxy-L-arabinose transferase-like glycosyltransferase